MAFESRRITATRDHRRARSCRADDELRRFLSRELHDRVAQTLTGMLIDLELFRAEQTGRRSVVHRVEGLQGELREVLGSLRELLHDLRGESRQLSETFPDSVATVLLDFERQTGIKTRLTVGQAWPQQLKSVAAANLSRIIGEALANVHRHSGAAHVAIALHGHGDSGVSITIRDDGIGLEPFLAAHPGLGIEGMRERAVLLGASLEVGGDEGSGTVISVVVPRGVVPEPALSTGHDERASEAKP
jgi:two-component system, NarL family, sensor histidine kinase UhpB